MAKGWVETAKFVTNPKDLVKKVFKNAEDFARFPDKSKLPQKAFTEEEVIKFDGKDGHPLYLIISGKVYDVTAFSDFHPAGPEPLQAHAGQDATEAIKLSGMPQEIFEIGIKRFRVGYIGVPEKE